MNVQDVTLIQIVKDPIKNVMKIKKSADQNVVKMMIVRVRMSFVMKSKDCVYQVICGHKSITLSRGHREVSQNTMIISLAGRGA